MAKAAFWNEVKQMETNRASNLNKIFTCNMLRQWIDGKMDTFILLW